MSTNRKRLALVLALLSVHQGVVACAQAFDAETAGYEELIFHFQRYATTPEKHARKLEADRVLRARGAESLRELMQRIHIENVGIGVLTLDMVEKMPGSNAAPVLVEFLASDRPKTRRMAAFLLGCHETPGFADRIVPLLADDEAAGAAVRTLGKWHVRAAVAHIVPFLAHEKEGRRIVAANALRDIGDPAAVPHLLPLLGDRFFTVREVAARALSTLGPRAEQALLDALPSAGAPARRHIIRTLGVMRSKKAVPALKLLLEDADPLVREDATRALEAIAARGAG